MIIVFQEKSERDNSDIKDLEEDKNNKEQKYFVSYCAYSGSNSVDWLNDFVYIDKEITPKLIISIQDDLINKLNAHVGSQLYYSAQIINFIKL
jgi:hypothetical protein